MPLSRSQLISLVEEYAYSYGIDPAIAVAQIGRESGYRADVVYGPFVGSAGERGIAQFIPGTWARYGSGDPYNPDDSLHAWGEYMSHLLAMFSGDYWKALAGYNGGPGHVIDNTISQRARSYATEILAQAGRASGGASASGGVPAWADYCDPDGFCYGQSWEQPTPDEPSGLPPWLFPVGLGIGLLFFGFIVLKD